MNKPAAHPGIDTAATPPSPEKGCPAETRTPHLSAPADPR